MGMDLSDTNGGCLHFNWSGWRTFGLLLAGLKCNTNCMDGLNDGRRIPKRTGRVWGRKIREALDKKWIHIGERPDPAYFGGSGFVLLVIQSDEELFATTLDTKVYPLADDKEWAEYLEEIAKFFENTEGCNQW